MPPRLAYDVRTRTCPPSADLTLTPPSVHLAIHCPLWSDFAACPGRPVVADVRLSRKAAPDRCCLSCSKEADLRTGEAAMANRDPMPPLNAPFQQAACAACGVAIAA